MITISMLLTRPGESERAVDFLRGANIRAFVADGTKVSVDTDFEHASEVVAAFRRFLDDERTPRA